MEKIRNIAIIAHVDHGATRYLQSSGNSFEVAVGLPAALAVCKSGARNMRAQL